MLSDVRPAPELLVVIPVYSEQASVAGVVHEWMQELAASCNDFTVLAIGDGSTDGSLQVLRLMLLVFFGVNCPDANVPYSLMRTDAIQWEVERIPDDFRLANVALAVLLSRDRRCSHAFVPIRFRSRRGGESSVRLWQFGRKSLNLHRDLRKLLRQPGAETETRGASRREDPQGAREP